MIKNFSSILLLLLPNSLKKFVYKKFFGWEIGENVKIGLSLIAAEKVILNDNVVIGHFNVVKNLKKLEIGMNSKIGNFNQCTRGNNDWPNYTTIGSNCGITSWHLFDSSGGLEIGDNVIIAGKNSQFWTHEVNVGTRKANLKTVSIGSHIYIGSSCLISPGATIPNESVLALGSVVPGNAKYKQSSLIAGNPAIEKKEINFKTVN